jgi:Holliday junction resolvasome RuvABC endonuclease subunit
MQTARRSLLGLQKLPEPADVADAIAAALCCANEL